MESNPYIDGTYTLFDANASGQVYALVKRLYPAPAFLKEFVSLRKALQEAQSICALEQGPCWVIRRDAIPPVRGQRCGRGECDFTPVAVVTKEGVGKVLPDGAVLPFWQRIFRVAPLTNTLARTPTMLYTSAVRAAMKIARDEGKPRIVTGWVKNGFVPLVYVDPGGTVRKYPPERGPEYVVQKMDRYEIQQAFAASRGGSILPFGI